MGDLFELAILLDVIISKWFDRSDTHRPLVRHVLTAILRLHEGHHFFRDHLLDNQNNLLPSLRGFLVLKLKAKVFGSFRNQFWVVLLDFRPWADIVGVLFLLNFVIVGYVVSDVDIPRLKLEYGVILSPWVKLRRRLLRLLSFTKVIVHTFKTRFFVLVLKTIVIFMRILLSYNRVHNKFFQRLRRPTFYRFEEFLVHNLLIMDLGATVEEHFCEYIHHLNSADVLRVHISENHEPINIVKDLIVIDLLAHVRNGVKIFHRLILLNILRLFFNFFFTLLFFGWENIKAENEPVDE